MKKPLFNWLDARSAGVLCHFTSLPSNVGIGNLGFGAHQMLHLLASAGMKSWQFCPLNPTGFGDSPYQSFSAFAGNPYAIDLEALIPSGLISTEDLAPLHDLPHDHVDYGNLFERFWPVLGRAFHRFCESKHDEVLDYGSFSAFCEAENAWLEDYAAFMALKKHFNGAPWYEWPISHRKYSKKVVSNLPKDVSQTAQAYSFFQYLFYAQLAKLHEHASASKISLIGDIPIFVSGDSADVWANPELFLLTPDLRPEYVAGVPPDYFSDDGQLWGNPLYDWDAHSKSKYKWWIARLEMTLRHLDVVRLDHFRGFEAGWSVPAKSKTARDGEWVKGPGIELFKALCKALPQAKLIAEDLGVSSSALRTLLAETGLPGMAVLQFAFGDGPENAFLPHNHTANSVVYSGTHDNDTSLGWYQTADADIQDHFRRYFGVSGEHAGWDLIRACFRSPARLALIPIQDLMSLGSPSRLNTPGTAQGNWNWRFQTWQLENLQRESAQYLREIAELYGR